MNDDTDRLVEQARELVARRAPGETTFVLAGLADAVERLQDDRGWVGQLNTALADAHKSAVKERDEARARVAALEAGLRDAERTLALYDSRLPLWDHARVELQAIRALLVPSTGQETT